ncbi:hypothetical protein Ctob_013235 [Chrysochromulina tobinii]|uniref:Uncharacterized protein n=1 Tax=Chrysochromulina tobinii TaxID=1460289 RepID=A0A0M0LQ71_9EUKA|nr:hypothetical protein Ctob_013235 [Chrysochromulina tobinii]|eukprot:KOO53027.1 hypothetical protein Ctob_013235 [Chrysochromulina sp. CCMP291]
MRRLLRATPTALPRALLGQQSSSVASSPLTTAARLLATSATHALPTRKQHFKEHLHKLREQDPARWSARALSRHFGVPLENIEAMLTLQALEAERKESGGALDAELLELADDAEEYLESEFAESAPAAEELAKGAGATLGASETLYDDDAPPSVTLEHMSLEHELALVGAVVARLSLDELSALEEQVRPPGQAQGAVVGAAGADEAAQRAAIQRSMLSSLCVDVPAPLLEPAAAGQAPLRLSAMALPPLPPRRAGVARPQAAARGVTVGDGMDDEAAKDEFWVDSSRPKPAMAPVRRAVSDDVMASPLRRPHGSPTGDWGQASTVEEMHSVRAPLFADELQSNIEARARRLAPDAQHWPYRKTGRFLFTELTRHSKKVPMAARVWVSEKDVGTREPSEREGRAAAVRAQPPILQPRIKRNM